MASSKYLSEAEVHKILRQVDDQRSFLPMDISGFTKTLNSILERYRLSEEIRKEPTLRQLETEFNEFRKALKKLKSALPTEQRQSLWNYLVHLGVCFGME